MSSSFPLCCTWQAVAYQSSPTCMVRDDAIRSDASTSGLRLTSTQRRSSGRGEWGSHRKASAAPKQGPGSTCAGAGSGTRTTCSSSPQPPATTGPDASSGGERGSRSARVGARSDGRGATRSAEAQDEERAAPARSTPPLPHPRPTGAFYEPQEDAASTDAELLAAHVARADPTAFSELTRRHRSRLWAVASAILRDPQDADDAVQDAMLRAFVHAGTFRGESSVYVWLRTLTVNVSTTSAAKRARLAKRIHQRRPRLPTGPRGVRSHQHRRSRRAPPPGVDPSPGGATHRVRPRPSSRHARRRGRPATECPTEDDLHPRAPSPAAPRRATRLQAGHRAASAHRRLARTGWTSAHTAHV